MQKNLGVYPNPSQNGVFNFKLDKQTKGRLTFHLYDLIGREVKFFELNNINESYQVNLSSQELGIYILKRSDGENRWINKLIYH